MVNSPQPTDPRVEIRSEARGPHWVAWRSGTGDTPDKNLVLLVGQTREEAEARARRWAGRQGGQSR